MLTATHAGGKSRILRLFLIAAIALNAVVVCSTLINPSAQPAHPCCPAPTDTSTRHCGHPGCKISDPVTVPQALPANNPATFVAIVLVDPATNPRAVATAAPLADQPRPSAELFIAFRQLLI